MEIGDNSPQVLGGLRCLVRCVFYQGRTEEAAKLHGIGTKLVNEMKEQSQAEQELKNDEMKAMVKVGQEIEQKSGTWKVE